MTDVISHSTIQVRSTTRPSCTHIENEMNGVIGHNSALQDYTGLGRTRAKEMDFVMNHTPGAGLIA